MYIRSLVLVVGVLIHSVLVANGRNTNLNNDVILHRDRRDHHQNTTEVLKDLFSNTSINTDNLTAGTVNATEKPTDTISGTNNTSVAQNASHGAAGNNTSLSTTQKPLMASTTSIMSSLSMFSTKPTENAQPEDSQCSEVPLFQSFCPVEADLNSVSFWDMYAVLYSDTVLEALVMECTKGVWCLNDRFDYWEGLIMERVEMVMNSEIMASFCNLDETACFDKMVDSYRNCTMHGQMVYVADSAKLVCHLKRNTELTTGCYKHMLSILHVTLADLMRKDNQESKQYKVCDSPGSNMTRNLICVTNACPSEIEVINGFYPWAWFTSVVEDLIQECHFDPNKCESLLQAPTALFLQGDIQAMIGVSVATMVTAILLTIALCTCYKRHRRNAVIKEGYQQLLNDGDES